MQEEPCTEPISLQYLMQQKVVPMENIHINPQANSERGNRKGVVSTIE